MPPHFQYYPQPAAMPMMAPLNTAHNKPPISNSMSPNNIPSAPKASLEKQMVNETIRRRISDKLLAQQVGSK